MLDPKNKAIELYNYFCFHILENAKDSVITDNFDYKMLDERVINSAMFAVRMILIEIDKKEYYQLVLNELELLLKQCYAN